MTPSNNDICTNGKQGSIEMFGGVPFANTSSQFDMGYDYGSESGKNSQNKDLYKVVVDLLV